MKITLDIDDEIIRDAVGGAAIGYWCDLERSTWSRKTMRFVLVEQEADVGGDVEHVLTRYDLQRGVEILATKYPHHFKDLIAQTGDAYTGDILIQCAAFGEEKYA